MQPAQFKAFDVMLESFWRRVVDQEADPLDEGRRAQLHLPLRLGGFAIGGVEVRAGAAFLSGAIGALPELKRSLGVATSAQLRTAIPNQIACMDTAAARLEGLGADSTVRAWHSEQPVGHKRPQRTWTSQIQDRV